ncbi:guanylate kinase [Caproiciproducens sp. NJN-50]|uniref:guanylate kinase n=1 Tax=Acutalibacteraceae TaxID=3082771 RepID=UPI000FFE1749|nr:MULTISPECIES: guanylate kinase [Acutalibacteraceae]QAT49417.1 guanylate kinase [Caproiciproducens sp. NJN-50]
MANDGLLLILSGPSGTGKGTVVKSLVDGEPGVRLSVSATTRAPRPGETEGKEYFFLTPDRFREMAGAGKMLESAEYCGNCYGTPLGPILDWTSRGLDVVLEIEVQGGAQVRRKRPDAVGIFILPPSLKELEHRLRQRGTETDEVIRGRLQKAKKEIPEAIHYDYIVINDTVESAVAQIRAIIAAEKKRSSRNRELIERILTDHD